MRRKATLGEVARSAGVSLQTVSNVVNNKPIVRKETRDLVLKHLALCGYRGNALARSLKTNTSRLIGLVVPSMTNSMYAEVAESVVYEAERRGYTVMMAVTKRDAQTETELVHTIIDHSAAGILMSPSDPAAEASKAAVKTGIPYVEMLNRGLEGGCDVFEADNFKGAFVAVTHLIAQGHRRIAFIGGLPNSTGTNRQQGYEEALAGAGIALDRDIIVCGEYTRDGGRLACEHLIAASTGFSAIFCASDLMAYGAMEAIAEQGLCVPKDISLVGFDDMSMSSLPGVNLTSVSFDPAKLAKRAVERLISIIETPGDDVSPIHDITGCILVERGSTRTVLSFREQP